MARPKGFAAWVPNARSQGIIDATQAVLLEYQSYLPMTIRQIFYRLVGTVGYPKDERAYKALCEVLNKARRAEFIAFDDIRDDGIRTSGGGGYDHVDQFDESIRLQVKYYGRDRLYEQAWRVELWCEAAGMMPQMSRATRDWSIPVYSAGGFLSVTATHELAVRVADEARPLVILHVGDHDPSGVSIYEALRDDVGAFVRQMDGPTLEVVRVAVTEQQVYEHGLETAPPKPSDTRSNTWLGVTAQAEAIPPDLLQEIVRDAMAPWIDADQYRASLDQEAADRAHLMQKYGFDNPTRRPDA